MSRAAGLAFARSGQLQAAREAFTKVQDWKNLSVTFAMERNWPEAIKAARRLREADRFAYHAQLMAIYWEMGDAENTLLHLTDGLRLRPDDPDLLTARGAYRLARKDWGGFEDIEHRKWARSMRAACDEVPEWDGKTKLNDKTLLINFQDGHGDRVMYSRFILDVWQRHTPREIIFNCSPDTARLFQESFPFVRVVSDPSIEINNDEVDCWIGLSSLGIAGYPIISTPYLRVPEDRKEYFSQFVPTTGNLRVGLVWAGNKDHKQDHTRSKSFSEFCGLSILEGVDFYSLQFDEHNLDHKGTLKELSIYCKDTADTCAAIANLDLVVGVDTGMIHFAGAQGVPAMVCCYTPIDWRWGLEDRRSYWYRSVEVLRDPTQEQIVEAVASYRGELPRKYYPVVELPSLSSTLETDTVYGPMEVFRFDLWIGRSLEQYGEWSQGELDLLEDVLDSDSVVVDAGANIGAFAIPVAKVVKHVFAFEPQAAVFDVLHRNIERNGLTNVSLAETALGEKHTQAWYRAPIMNAVGSPGSVALQDTGSHSCKVFPLDALELKQLTLLKADVEGMELAVLRGAKDTINRLRPLLYVEVNDAADRAELLLHIDQLGYRMYEHSPQLFNPDNFKENLVNVFGTWDSKMLFCVPKERFDLRHVTRQLSRLRLEIRNA